MLIFREQTISMIKNKQKFTFLLLITLLSLFVSNISSSSAETEKDMCKAIFSDADIISDKFENPPHYKIYSIDKKTKKETLIGIAFFTTDLAPDIYGYGGKIKILVGVDSSNSIVGTKLIAHSETPSFTKNFPTFLEQFKGKNISEKFTLGEDIDGITGATISCSGVTNSIKESLIPIKTLLLNTAPENNKKKATNKPFIRITIPVFIFLLGSASFFLKKTYLSKITMLLSLIFLGLLTNCMLSTSHFSGLLLLNIPSFEHNTITCILLLLTITSCIILGRVYCCNICPFAAIQEMIFNISKKAGIKPKNINKGLDYKFQKTKYVILFALLFCSILFKKSYIGAIEPYITFFSLMGSKAAWLLLSFVLFSSVFYFRFWCRFFCPTGAFLGLISKFNFLGFRLSKDSKDCSNVCPVRAIKYTDKNIAKINGSECILCQKCSTFCK